MRLPYVEKIFRGFNDILFNLKPVVDFGLMRWSTAEHYKKALYRETKTLLILLFYLKFSMPTLIPTDDKNVIEFTQFKHSTFFKYLKVLH